MWHLKDIRGPRAQIKTKIAAEKFPADVTAFLGSQIDSFGPEVTNFKIDAYSQDCGNKSAMTVSRIVQFSIVGMRL